MDLSFGAEYEDFRAEVRAFLEDYRDLDGFFGQGDRWKQVKDMFRAMGERGWLALAWPEEYGGLGLGAVDGVVIAEELAYGCTGMMTGAFLLPLECL